MIVLLLTVAICSVVLVRQYLGRVFETPQQRLSRDVRKYRQAFLRTKQEQS